MVGSRAAISILLDAVFTMQGTTGGDDGNPLRTVSGSSITFKADKVTARNNRSAADHSSGQDAAEFMRTAKKPQTITVETKLQKKANAELLALLASAAGTVVTFQATATGASIGTDTTGGAGNLGGALVEEYEFDYAGPSTLRFTLRQYGTEFVVSAA